MNKEIALEYWDKHFGNKETAYDYASHPMKREEYGNENSIYGWDIDYVKPLKFGGKESEENLIASSVVTKEVRHERVSFSIGNFSFEVRRNSNNGFSVYDITRRDNPICMDPNDENQDPEYNKNRLHEKSKAAPKQNFVFRNPNDIGNNMFSSLASAFIPEPVENDDEDEEEEEYEEEEDSEEECEESEDESDEGYQEESEDEESEENEEIEEDEEETDEISEEENEEIDEESEEENSEENEFEEIEEDSVKEEEDEVSEEKEIEEQLISSEEEQEKQEELTSEESEEESKKENEISEEKSDTEVSDIEENMNTEENGDEAKDEISTEEQTEVENPEEKEEENDNSYDSHSSEPIPVEEENEESEENEVEEKEEEIPEVGQLVQDEEAEKEQEEFTNEYNNQLEELKKEVERLKEENEQYRNDPELVSKYEASQAAILKLNTVLEEVSAEINDYKNEAKSKDDEITSLKNMILDYENRFRKEEENKENEAKAKEEESTRVNNLLAEKDGIISEKEERIKQLVSERDGLVQEKNEAENSSEMHYQEEQRLAEELKQSQEREKEITEEKDSQIQNLTVMMKEKQSVIDSLTEEKNRIVMENEDVQNQQNAEIEEKENQINDLNTKLAQETQEKTRLKKSLDQLEAQSQLISDQLEQKDYENSQMEKKSEEDDEEIENLQKENDELSEKIESLKSFNERLHDEKEELNKEIDKNKIYDIYLIAEGNPSLWNEFQKDCKEKEISLTEENIKSRLCEEMQWRRSTETGKVDDLNPEDVTLVSEEKTEQIRKDERKEKAFSLYFDLYGYEKNEVSDFSGRNFRLDDYQNSDSNYGWDFVTVNKNEPENKENVILANLSTIKDVRFGSSFMTNGHTFSIVKDGDSFTIRCEDYVTDPFDYFQAMRVTKFNQTTTSPLVYIFVKIVGAKASIPSDDSVLFFFDLIDRTVKRCCPESFIEIKTYGKGNNYAFITFDGKAENAYKEVLDYATLLNSYRREFKKDKGTDCIIVINEIDVPFSMRHLDFDKLISMTRDVEMLAIRQDLNVSSFVDSTISRTIHIGPKISEKLPVNLEKCSVSQIAQNDSKSMYVLSSNFYLYNYRFNLKKTEVNNGNE